MTTQEKLKVIEMYEPAKAAQLKRHIKIATVFGYLLYFLIEAAIIIWLIGFNESIGVTFLCILLSWRVFKGAAILVNRQS